MLGYLFVIEVFAAIERAATPRRPSRSHTFNPAAQRRSKRYQNLQFGYPAF
jgi:hypothetical protein